MTAQGDDHHPKNNGSQYDNATECILLPVMCTWSSLKVIYTLHEAPLFDRGLQIPTPCMTVQSHLVSNLGL